MSQLEISWNSYGVSDETKWQLFEAIHSLSENITFVTIARGVGERRIPRGYIDFRSK